MVRWIEDNIGSNDETTTNKKRDEKKKIWNKLNPLCIIIIHVRDLCRIREG